MTFIFSYFFFNLKRLFWKKVSGIYSKMIMTTVLRILKSHKFHQKGYILVLDYLFEVLEKKITSV